MQGKEITYWTDLEKVASDIAEHRKTHPGGFDLDLFKQKES